MLLYEIDAALADLLSQVDEETGELKCSPEDIDALMMEREKALEGIALTVKNLDAEAVAIRAEELALADRRKRLESRSERTREFLQRVLAGDKFKTPRVAVTYRTSDSTDFSPDWIATVPIEYLRVKSEIDKKKVMEDLKAGKVIPGARLVKNTSMTIR